MDDILVFVEETAQPTASALVHVGEDVKLLGAVLVQGCGKDHGVMSILFHRVNVSVYVQLNIKLVHFTLSLNPRYYIILVNIDSI